jgi:hypothetical protein
MLVKLTKALESDGSLQHAQQGHVVEGYRKNFARTSGLNPIKLKLHKIL